jgi:hypothetical protein
MKIDIDHCVRFTLEDSEGPILPQRRVGYARLDHVTVDLLANGRCMVWAGALTCRKDGQPDKRLGGKQLVSVDLPDEEKWVQKARDNAFSYAPGTCV